MRSLILCSVTRFVTPFLMLMSVFLLLRGHNSPGGGFAGGLVATTALALHMFAFGEDAMKRIVRVDPRTLFGIGLVLAVVTGLVSLLAGSNFLTGMWISIPTPLGTLKLGSPVFFDIGVYLVVIGVTVSFLEDMFEEETT